VLDVRPAVFLSCSKKSQETVAIHPRRPCGFRVEGVIVIAEPLLPPARSDPDGQMNSYLDGSEALVRTRARRWGGHFIA
jgi:hypothetical protein